MLTLRLLFPLFLLMPLCAVIIAQAQNNLPDTVPLTAQGDLAAEMVSGIDAYLLRELDASPATRAAGWKRDFSSPEHYTASVEPNRKRFLKMIGAVDAREAVSMQTVATFPAKGEAGVVGQGDGYRIYAVRWNVFPGVEGEGLLLQPDKTPLADIIALPDCDWTPEMLAGLTPDVPKEAQFARRLAENGCRVLIPMLLNRQDTYSGLPGGAMTNEPHREFIYRAAYEMGRHIIGFEVQKTLAAVDWFLAEGAKRGRNAKRRPIGVLGYGEGGLIAFYAAAADTRIDAAVVSGYFQPREALWREPIYRNVFGLLQEFGDAEIASLIAPRPLIIEACRHPEIPGPPQDGRSGAAPGAIMNPSLASVQAEAERARALTKGLQPPPVLTCIVSGNGKGLPGTEATLIEFLKRLGHAGKLASSGRPPRSASKAFPTEARLKRQFDQLADYTQVLMRDSPKHREEFWSRADFSSVEKLQATASWYRDYFWDEIIGRLPPPSLPPHPSTRKIYDTPKFVGYEVTLDLYPDVFAYGILLIPKDIRPGERRAVVVCQHGLEGRAQDVADPAVDSPGYHQFACKLAEQGFITYAPQNPYIGEDKFRQALRKAQPLKLTLFSFIVRQHERTLEWLAGLPFVDRSRIAFYGLSYGGKTAMRVPAVLPGYCLSICSADYNEWVWKNASMHSRYSYLLWGEYDMPEFDLANTFNYAEMSWLICPRPFMVERGHDDGVAPDEWVAYEYARTRRVYDLLGLGDRTEMEVFNGPHTIHGVGTFAFLHRLLDKPAETRP